MNDQDRYEYEVQQEEWLADQEEQKVYQQWLDQINGNPAPMKSGFSGDENGFDC